MKITRTFLKHNLKCLVYDKSDNATHEMDCVVYNPRPGHLFKDAFNLFSNENLELLKILEDKTSTEKRFMNLQDFIKNSEKDGGYDEENN